jgi:hypothetical protein
MTRHFVLAATIVAVGLSFSSHAWGLAMEEIGNKPLAEANYKDWKGIVPLVNDKARVYTIWVNGNESFYYKAGVKELNEALEKFAKVEVKNHVVVLRPGTGVRSTFDKVGIAYQWELHVVGGIAATRAVDDIEDLDWQKDPVLTIYIGGDIELDKLKFPDGVKLRYRADDETHESYKKVTEFVDDWRLKHEPVKPKLSK